MIAMFRREKARVGVWAAGLVLITGAATWTSRLALAAEGARSSAPSQELNTTISMSGINSVPLSDVLTKLAEQTHLNFAVNWKAMETVGIDRNTLVSVNLKEVPLHKVLDVVLSQVDPNLGYEFSDNVLMIAPNQFLVKNSAPRTTGRVTRVYNVRDLTEKAVADESATQPGQQAVFQGMSPMDAETSKLEGVIQQTIEAGSWGPNGESQNSVADFHGLITVTATEGVQEKVAELLENLRKADRDQGKK